MDNNLHAPSYLLLKQTQMLTLITLSLAASKRLMSHRFLLVDWAASSFTGNLSVRSHSRSLLDYVLKYGVNRTGGLTLVTQDFDKMQRLCSGLAAM